MLFEQHQVESDMSGPDEPKYSLRKSLRQFLDKQKSLIPGLILGIFVDRYKLMPPPSVLVTLCRDGSNATEVHYKWAGKRILGLFRQSFTKCIKDISYVFFIPE